MYMNLFLEQKNFLKIELGVYALPGESNCDSSGKIRVVTMGKDIAERKHIEGKMTFYLLIIGFTE